MTGRGRGILLRTSSEPTVTIGLTLRTSPSTLSHSTEEPFFIVVTARILTTPQPDKSITLWTHLSPLDGLETRAFSNITCMANPSKHIEIWPHAWPRYIWDSEDMRAGGWARSFITIPPKDKGVYEVKHEVPHAKIDAANLHPAEKYEVKLTDKCLGTMWWAYGALDEFDGVRFRQWRSREQEEQEAADETVLEEDEELSQETRRARYGDGPATKGEDPSMLAMVDEGGPIEFNVV